MGGLNQSAEHSEKLYNSRILANYMKLFKERYKHVKIEDLLEYAGIDAMAIDDPFEWFTQNQVNRFYERLSTYFDNPEQIAREAGQYIYNDKVLGLFKQFSLKLLGVGHVYKNIANYANALTRSSVYTSREISSNKYEITVKLHKNVVESPHQEHNRLGILEAAPLMFSDKMAKVESSRDGGTIKYMITWPAPKSEKINNYKIFSLVISTIAIFLTLLGDMPQMALFCFLLALIVYLSMALAKEKALYKELHKFHQSHESSAEKIIQTYIEDYEHVKTLNRIGRIILRHGSGKHYLAEIASTLSQLKYRKAAFFISDFSKDHITCKHNNGYHRNVGSLKIDLKDLLVSDKALGSTIYFDRSDSFNAAVGINSTPYFSGDDFPLVFIPIVYDITLLGYFFITPDSSLLPFGKKKKHFLSGIASQIALGIHNQQAFFAIAESDRIKTEFITTASHELKTPLQTMMGAISEIESTGNIHDNLPVLKTVVSNMAGRTKGLLSLHHLESKKYELDLRLVSIDAVLAKIKDEMLSSSKVYSHCVIFEGFSVDGPEIMCDLNRLSTAIMNLFNNSCKYTPPPGAIIVKYEYGIKEHRFSIIDNGVGIDKKDQDKVFIKFYQVPNDSINTLGGFGLGLSIVKEIAHLHNGDIIITSPVYEDHVNIHLDSKRPGTCVTVNLPI